MERRVSDSLPLPCPPCCFIYNFHSIFCHSPNTDHSFVLFMSKSSPDTLTITNLVLPLSRKSSDLVKHKTTPSKAMHPLTLSRRLPFLPNHSVCGSWSMKVKKHFIVTSGHVEVGQKLLVDGAEFTVSGFSGCGWDYLVLSVTQEGDETDNWLVIPDRYVCLHLISWHCPIHYLLLRLLMCCLGFVFRTVKSHFGFVLVSKFLLPFVLILIDPLKISQPVHTFSTVDASTSNNAMLSTPDLSDTKLELLDGRV